jgi:hypothetical protein
MIAVNFFLTYQPLFILDSRREKSAFCEIRLRFDVGLQDPVTVLQICNLTLTPRAVRIFPSPSPLRNFIGPFHVSD